MDMRVVKIMKNGILEKVDGFMSLRAGDLFSFTEAGGENVVKGCDLLVAQSDGYLNQVGTESIIAEKADV